MLYKHTIYFFSVFRFPLSCRFLINFGCSLRAKWQEEGNPNKIYICKTYCFCLEVNEVNEPWAVYFQHFNFHLLPSIWQPSPQTTPWPARCIFPCWGFCFGRMGPARLPSRRYSIWKPQAPKNWQGLGHCRLASFWLLGVVCKKCNNKKRKRHFERWKTAAKKKIGPQPTAKARWVLFLAQLFGRFV